MLEEIPSLSLLLKVLQQVPYLASKNIYGVASHFIDMPQAKMAEFCKLLLDAHNKLKRCPNCFCLQEAENKCLFCSSSVRDQSIVCVVETWHEVLAIEKTRGYTGVYHVLGGAICPLEGVGPEDLTIDSLFARAQEGTVAEVILATNQTPEGEATAVFIATQLKKRSVKKVSCLARGLPVGSRLEAMDRLTVYKALSERRIF